MSKITHEMNMHNCQLCKNEWLGRCLGKCYGKDVSFDNEPCDDYKFGGSAQRLKEIEQHEKEQTLSNIHFQMEKPLSYIEIESLQNAFGEIYERGKSDGVRKFAEWLCEHNAGIVDADNEEWKIKTIYRGIESVIEEYEKETEE